MATSQDTAAPTDDAPLLTQERPAAARAVDRQVGAALAVTDQTLAINVAAATERRCYRCRVTRPIGMFYVEIEQRRAAREGRSQVRLPCRVCQREINDAARREKQDYVDGVKAERGCADCHMSMPDHPEVFDLDHLPGAEKVAAISTLLTKGTFDELVAEVAKCEVVCANCHRIRTRARGSSSFGRSRS